MQSPWPLQPQALLLCYSNHSGLLAVHTLGYSLCLEFSWISAWLMSPHAPDCGSHATFSVMLTILFKMASLLPSSLYPILYLMFLHCAYTIYYFILFIICYPNRIEAPDDQKVMTLFFFSLYPRLL